MLLALVPAEAAGEAEEFLLQEQLADWTTPASRAALWNASTEAEALEKAAECMSWEQATRAFGYGRWYQEVVVARKALEHLPMTELLMTAMPGWVWSALGVAMTQQVPAVQSEDPLQWGDHPRLRQGEARRLVASLFWEARENWYEPLPAMQLLHWGPDLDLPARDGGRGLPLGPPVDQQELEAGPSVTEGDADEVMDPPGETSDDPMVGVDEVALDAFWAAEFGTHPAAVETGRLLAGTSTQELAGEDEPGQVWHGSVAHVPGEPFWSCMCIMVPHRSGRSARMDTLVIGPAAPTGPGATHLSRVRGVASGSTGSNHADGVTGESENLFPGLLSATELRIRRLEQAPKNKPEPEP